jgi:DNA-binding winged helix-turn-helix (wHTH) protein
MNYSTAEDLFKEVLSLSPDDSHAHYRLGYIYIELKNWDQAVSSFGKSLHDELGIVKKVRAYCALAIAYTRLGKKKQAEEYLKKAEVLDVGRDYSTDIQQAKASMNNKKKDPYIVYRQDDSFMTLDEPSAEHLLCEAEDAGQFVLNLTSSPRNFNGAEETVYLEKREAEIIKFFVSYPRAHHSLSVLRESIWDNSADVKDSTIKGYISTIRSKLKKAFDQNGIETKRGYGYKWAMVEEVKIIEAIY